MFAELEADIAARREAGLLRVRRVVDGACGPQGDVDGRACLSFASNDYLGLAADPRLVEALVDGAKQYGVGGGASHLVSGHSTAHHRLERELADFVGGERALLFSTGYMANLGIITALMGRGDEIFADRLNHASLYDAAQLSRARLRRYVHGDLDMLARQLAESQSRRKLVVTDAVFSMDGDVAPVPQLLELCAAHGAWLMLDDAHGFGVLGESGRGTLAHFGVSPQQVIYMATLGKAAGVAGAFVAGAAPLVEALLQRARTYIYTTAMPPPLACALSASLALIRSEDGRRQHLQALIARLQQRLPLKRWRLMASPTPIQPLLVGANDEALRLTEGLLAEGIYVPAIRPPTVPQATARLRISLSAAHTVDDVDRLAAALVRLEGALA